MSPTAVVKEILENSLDAGARVIRVTLEETVLARIEIEDDGDGVAEEDLPLLCRRHATSKLRAYSDLASMSTLGFRGEGLSAVSALAKVTVFTATADGDGVVGEYQDGVLVKKKPAALKKGTRVVVTDLFHHDAVKRDAYLGNKQEIKKIGALIMKYAVCYHQVRFEVSKEGVTQRYNTVHGADQKQRIAQVFSAKLQPALIQLAVAAGGAQCRGYITHANAALSTGVTIVFVNQRLVEMPRIKRAVMALYKEVLVKGHPFIYLEIRVPPAQVDVNVHPAKTEVFLQEEQVIVEALEEEVRRVLQTQRMVGTAKIGKLAGGENLPPEKKLVRSNLKSQPGGETGGQPASEAVAPNPPVGVGAKRAAGELGAPSTPSKKVRTDSQALPLNLFLSPKLSKRAQLGAGALAPREIRAPTTAPATIPVATEELRLAHGVFIGMASRSWALVQKGTELWLLDIGTLTREYFTRHFCARQPSLEPAGESTTIGVPEPVAAFINQHRPEGHPDCLQVLPNQLVAIAAPTLRHTGITVSLNAADLSTVVSGTPGSGAETLTGWLAEIYTGYLLQHHPLIMFKELQGYRCAPELLVALTSVARLYQLFNR